MNLWLFYPLKKCLHFMEHTQWELQSHVLRIGHIAFMVVWRRKRKDTQHVETRGF